MDEMSYTEYICRVICLVFCFCGIVYGVFEFVKFIIK